MNSSSFFRFIEISILAFYSFRHRSITHRNSYLCFDDDVILTRIKWTSVVSSDVMISYHLRNEKLIFEIYSFYDKRRELIRKHIHVSEIKNRSKIIEEERREISVTFYSEKIKIIRSSRSKETLTLKKQTTRVPLQIFDIIVIHAFIIDGDMPYLWSR